jgi:hypothetical protein
MGIERVRFAASLWLARFGVVVPFPYSSGVMAQGVTSKKELRQGVVSFGGVLQRKELRQFCGFVAKCFAG